MDVIDMALVIEFVADQVFPITPLPDAAFAADPLDGGERLGCIETARKQLLDHLPAPREIGVILGQRPQAMHVFGQHHPGIDMEGMADFGYPNRFPQQGNMARQQIAFAIAQVDGEEVRSAGNPGAAVAGHGGSSVSRVWSGAVKRWTGEALSTLRRRRAYVCQRRVEMAKPFPRARCPGYLATSLFRAEQRSGLPRSEIDMFPFCPSFLISSLAAVLCVRKGRLGLEI